jgi:thioredoxin-like negative regulator of GroEL
VLRASIVIAVIAATPSIAYPCMNEVLRGEEAIKLMAEIESYLDKGQYRQAANKIHKTHAIYDRRLMERATDARALIALRTRTAKDDVTWTVDHFKKRSEAKESAKDVRFRSWLAEAYAANGKIEPALEILTDLKKRDLMPDGFAFVTLAKLSSGADREAALEACTKRAKVKSICTLPVDKTATRS